MIEGNATEMAKFQSIEQLNESLMEIKANRRERDRLQAKMQKITESLKTEEVRAARLGLVLKKELKDVENLEGLSVAGLFHAILGRLPEQWEKERTEYLAAKLQNDECLEAIEIMKLEKEQMSEQLMKLSNVDKDYEEILINKEVFLLSTDSSASGVELLRFAEQLSDTKADIKELKEAIDAGKSVLVALKELRGSLLDAQTMGCWDMFGGGGLLVSVGKFAVIDQAKKQMNRVQQLLRSLERELTDVKMESTTEDPSIEEIELNSFVDVCFDNWISDFITQSKIDTAAARAKKATSQVTALVDGLSKELKSKQAMIKEIDEQRLELLETAN